MTGEPRRLEHRLDLGSGGARDDRNRDALRGVAHRLAHLVRDRRAVGGELPVAVDPALEHLAHRRMIRPEPGAHDLGVGQARELVEVLLGREGPVVFREELLEDRKEDRLVVRERSVEIEDDCPSSHGAEGLWSHG